MRKNTALRWTAYVAIAIAFAIACAFLSNWQFERNTTRAAANTLIAENYDAAPVALAELLPADARFQPGDEWRPVALRGSYLADDTLLARNRPRGGTSAFEVLVPFRLDDGRVILVDRGWIPPADDSAPSAVPAPPSGEATVVARLRPEEAAPTSGRSAPAGQVATVNVGLVAKGNGLELVPGVYALMASESPAPASAPHQIDAPTEDPGPHLSYAIQWILFAVMGFVFIGYMIRTELRVRREEREGRAPQPKRRRRDRDADAEDALLDLHA